MGSIPRKKTLKIYADAKGREPFSEWMKSVRDVKTRSRIRTRLDRVELGNYGDCESLGDGVFELRLFFGSGYRIYFGEVENTIVLLLCGGDKKGQKRDVQKAKVLWKEFNQERMQ